VRETWQEVFETEYDENAEGYCVNVRTLIPDFNDIPKVCAGLSTEDSCSAMKPRNKFYVYKASNIKFSNPQNGLCWRPSIHMPKEAARIFLRITDVKAERLQNITENGAKAEGTDADVQIAGGYVLDGYYRSRFATHLWNSTVKKSDLDRYGWGANPWVWVYQFERIGEKMA